MQMAGFYLTPETFISVENFLTVQTTKGNAFRIGG